MTNLAPFRVATLLGMSDAGTTVSELPIARHRSAFSAY